MFLPPVCNKLIHKDQLSIMFVGGPNSRTDFHLDLGSEFFYQLKGEMWIATIQQGHRKVVQVSEGQVYLLPSRVPHSPQRPSAESLGLVVERRREACELDGLRWYSNFDVCDQVLYERYFHCGDLGRDLVPVVQAFKASQEFAQGVPKEDSVPKSPPFKVDGDTEVPEPFGLKAWLAAHAEELAKGADLNLFEGHPDGEVRVRVIGGPSSQTESFEYETFFYQLAGQASVSVAGRPLPVSLKEGSCFVVDSGTAYTATRGEGSVGLVVTQDPRGNKDSERAPKAAKVEASA